MQPPSSDIIHSIINQIATNHKALMFPQIAKKKKKDFVADDRMIQEWEDVAKELDGRSKLALKKIPNAILHDFSKVCRIKSIPEFYANYFLCFIQRANDSQQSLAFSQEIELLLTHKSFFHQINDILRQREEIINSIRDSLIIVEGFILMNQGKNVSLNAKGTIDELVKDCESLEKLKELQKRKVEEFARNIIRIRTNTVNLIDKVIEWRKYLEGVSKVDSTSKLKLKIIYPHLAINCLLLALYDTLFIKTTTLKSQISFGKEQEDPFLQKMTKSKKGTQIQTYFFDELKIDTINYKDYAILIKNEIPSDEAEELREKQLEKQREQQRIKEQKLKQQSLREQRLKNLREDKNKKIRIRRYSSLKNIKDAQPKKEEEVDRGIGYRTSRGERSEKKIINIDALIKQKSQINKPKSPNKSILNRSKIDKKDEDISKDELKIIGVYNKSKRKRNMPDSSVIEVKQDDEEKRIWQKQMKEEQLQKEKIKRLLKQTERKAMLQTKQFEDKLKKYEEEVANLKSKVDASKRSKRVVVSSEKPRSPLKQGKNSVVSIYTSSVKPKEANFSILESKLQQQSKIKKNLELQIKQLGKQKQKLQKMLSLQSSKISRQSEAYQKKIQKYEQVIGKLKNQSENNKKMIRQIENSKITQEKKISQNLRMYTIREKQEELKKKIQARVQQRENRKKMRQAQMLQQSKQKERKKEQLKRSRSRSEKSINKSFNNGKDVEIIKTKQTIQIVFESKGRRRDKEFKNKELVETENRLNRLEKQRELLEKKLQMSAIGKEDKKKLFETKIQQKEQRMDKFKEEVKKQRQRNQKLQENIKQMRKNINNEYDVKLHKERIKFEKEREELLQIIEKERYEKSTKDKYLDQQMKFLKEMQKNQNELMNLLQHEKRQRKQKERKLAEELEVKEELMSLLEIQQIKKGIEREVRKELLESDDEDDEQLLIKEKRKRMEEEIEHLKEEKFQEINEMDQQNVKLKELIQRIKGQQNKLLQAIKQNIEMQSEEQQPAVQPPSQAESQLKHQPDILPVTKSEDPQPQSLEMLQVINDQLGKQLERKTLMQFKSQEKKRKNYVDIEKSPNYKEKEKIENLVQFYLKGPHHYPEDRQVKIDLKEKKEMLGELTSKAKMIQDFQSQLFSLKQLPDFVPSQKDNAINNHLLNLREVYEDYEADALRRELFPPLQNDEVYNAHELSVQSEQAPIISIMDDVNAHAKKYSPKKQDKKNFLAINRMRLMLLQDDRKNKQRKLIEQQAKRRLQKEMMEKKRKQREEKLQKERQKERLKQLEKQKKQEEKMKKNKQRKQKIVPQNEKSDASRNSSKDSKNSKTKTKKNSEKGQSESEIQKQINLPSDTESKKSNKSKEKTTVDKNEKEKPKEEHIVPIKEEQNEQSADLRQSEIEDQAQKEKKREELQRQLLKEEIKSIQEEVRSYISGDEQFNVYQQFIPAEEIENRIQQILDLSSEEVIKLNGNNTLKNDAPLYCTVTILIAKDQKGIQIGIGVYHKEYQAGEYVCDFVVAHKMVNFLNLVFNFSRFIYNKDQYVGKIQYLFDLQHIIDKETLQSFVEFENKCKRLGQVYIKAKNSRQRKYILKRALFEEVDDIIKIDGKGIDIDIKLQLYEDVLKEINQGYTNVSNLNYCSISIILAYYLSKTPDKLTLFREKFEHELYYREILVTALLFAKKQLQIKNISLFMMTEKQKSININNLKDSFDVRSFHENPEQMRLQIIEKLPLTIKRCVLSVGYQEIKYLVYKPEEAVTRIQSSNSSETGIFLGIIPKYKLLILQAEQFLTMSEKNPDLTAFFYVKHFVKNIVDVKKEMYERVYIPQVTEQSFSYFNEMGKKMDDSIFLDEKIQLGWKTALGNSLIFKPQHKDLVIQRPFIMALMSGPVERAVQGSPICVKVVL